MGRKAGGQAVRQAGNLIARYEGMTTRHKRFKGHKENAPGLLEAPGLRPSHSPMLCLGA